MKKVLGVLLGCVASIGIAQATIIDHGNFLTDTASRLDWLDVTLTAGKPRFLTERDLWTGSVYEGWRFATGDEFNALVSHYTGTSISSYGIVYQAEGLLDGLVTMLGSTLDAGYEAIMGQTYDYALGVAEGDGVDYTYGFLADSTTVNGYYYVAMLADVDGPWIWGGLLSQSDKDYSIAHDAAYNRVGVSSYIGSYLVRESASIPEPTSILLMLAAGLGIVGVRQSRKSVMQQAD